MTIKSDDITMKKTVAPKIKPSTNPWGEGFNDKIARTPPRTHNILSERIIFF